MGGGENVKNGMGKWGSRGFAAAVAHVSAFFNGSKRRHCQANILAATHAAQWVKEKPRGGWKDSGNTIEQALGIKFLPQKTRRKDGRVES